MTAEIRYDAQYLREFMAQVEQEIADMPGREEPFDFELSGASGDNTVTLDAGWKPKRVMLNGVEQRPGTGNQVTFQQDADLWQVVFATDPLVTDWIRVWAEAQS